MNTSAELKFLYALSQKSQKDLQIISTEATNYCSDLYHRYAKIALQFYCVNRLILCFHLICFDIAM